MALSSASMPQASSIFATYASISAFIMLIQTMLNQFVPRQVQDHIFNVIRHYFRPRTNNATIVIEERDGMSNNEVYDAAEIYLCTKLRQNVDRLKISKRYKETDLCIKFAKSDKISDTFEGIELEWKFRQEEKIKSSQVMNMDNNGAGNEKKYFELSFDKKHKERVLDYYVPFVLENAKGIKAKKKVIKLHTLDSRDPFSSSIKWDSINLEHPSTFDTLAMDPELKRSIIDDLDRFLRRKELYRKVGRAWKRGYLLYGPPGTGKSSLIAAMANYLKFDIYDLELTNVKRDSDLRNLLLRTSNKSILVIEDIDCSVQLPNRKHKITETDGKPTNRSRSGDQQFTLSGLLNFIDGLWSSCGDQRIIVFTTNNKDKLDPALLRPGRMDKHIHMSYLTPEGFKLLASRYLGIEHEHPLFREIEELITKMNVSPAEVAEELLIDDDADTCLSGLIDFLKCKEVEEKNKILKGEDAVEEDD